MTVEKNYTVAIAMLIDWLKNLEPDFQPTRSKTKPNPISPCRYDFSCAFEQLRVIARNSN